MTPDTVIIHCSATRETQDVPVETIDMWHKDRGFKRPVQTEKLKHIGYHYYIRRDGTVYPGREESEQGAHCTGYNSHSLGICYEGGLDAAGNTKDTRTTQQKNALNGLIELMMRKYKIKEILGHRDTSPDLNGNGTIEPFEWIKSCPCFDAKNEYKHFLKTD